MDYFIIKDDTIDFKFEIDFNDFNSCYISGSCYEGIENKNMWLYTGEGGYEDVKSKNIIPLFNFIFSYRGVWEGRVYFKYEEYMSEDLKIITRVWEKAESKLKEIIKSKNQNHYNFDD